MGKTLILMRHAQAAMPDPGMKDFDRPLTAHGAAEAVSSAKLLRATGIVPDLIIASPSRRTLETTDQVKSIIGENIPVETQMTLYSGDTRFYLDAVLTASSAASMIIGHNPMTEQLALNLASMNGQTPREMRVGFATAGIAVFDLIIENGSLKNAHLLNYISP
jgi:phosphohistidine phosphatase